MHHENYTDTGLASGDDKVLEACEAIDEYIDNTNKTSWDEEKKMNMEFDEIGECAVKLEDHPCPCKWTEWEQWSECSTTCGEGVKNRTRAVEKNATNGGAACEGPSEENEPCNAEFQCSKLCQNQ